MGKTDRLPCDVLVQPATVIKRGCRIETLLECIEMRRERDEKGPPLPDILSRRQAAEIMRLRAAIADLLAHRVGDVPGQGWLRDNDASRAALAKLAALTDTKGDRPMGDR